ncbi:hypothetical protein Poly51_48740 [Rubripirellula tenax]|uniref:Uncharacterized protein n=1 Tax=Rubripirellula tenax TaxID=2528015 RepID=A0A5C6EKG4_9BACT|nr:DUF3806 domain-containing protein [Rubripirellula tenax]TWU48970.1 hypothetical protein Poly51_48740 [Rubripirellula tenax]
MNPETNESNDAVVDIDPADPQASEFVKYAAHASWLAPIAALLVEGRFSSVASDATNYGYIATLALILAVSILTIAGFVLGIYAFVRGRNVNGVRKPAAIGVVLCLGFLVLFLGGVVHGFRNATANDEITDNDLVTEMSLFAGDAVKVAHDQFEIPLDYSPESIEFVEVILAQLHDQHAEKPFTSSQLTDHALQWGGYVGEVLKTFGDCDWALESSDGSGTYPIVCDDNTEVLPIDWCYVRIAYGAEHDVRPKFAAVANGRHRLDAAPSSSIDSGPQDEF